MKQLSRIVLIELHAVELIHIGMEAVEGELIQDPEADEQAAGHSNGQPGDVDEGVALVAFDVADSDFKIVLKHVYAPEKGIKDKRGDRSEDLSPVPEGCGTSPPIPKDF
jgi:hypothetical protein